MKHLSLLLIFLSISILSYGINVNKGCKTAKNYFTEIKIEDYCGRIIVPIKIQGKTYRFMLDTGAPCSIKMDVMVHLKHELMGGAKVTDCNGTASSMFAIMIPSIELGNVRFEDVPFLVYNNPLLDCYGIDGLIGSNLLRKSIVQISRDSETLIVTDRKEKLDLPDQSVKMFLLENQSTPYVDMDFRGTGNVSDRVMFDSGDPGFIRFARQKFTRLAAHEVIEDYQEGVGRSAIGISGYGESTKHFKTTIPTVDIAGVNFQHVNLLTTEHPDSRIGTELLDHGDVTLDYKHRRLYYSSKTSTVDKKEKTLGFRTSLKEDQLIVGIVWDRQLKRLMHFGDVITEVNGIDLTSNTACDYLTGELPFESDDVFVIKLKDKDGKEKTVEVRKK
ncbi:hypothetical protein EYV94_23350 [Puteibacter caeruleilacunae]|nr:hypothetical protein EYV94_23350 [Puteibacter caeruleilacunae]